MKEFRKVHQPFNDKWEYDNLEASDTASKVLALIAGENPTYLNVRYDITMIKIKEGGGDEVIEKELRFIKLINQKYRKSSKSWSIRQQLIPMLTYINSKD